MIAASLTRDHRGDSLRLPEDPKHKHRRYLIRDVQTHNGHVVVTAFDSYSRNVVLPIPNGTPVVVGE